MNTFPTAEISNAEIAARLYLPDRRHGYYRGTRFDWSGVIASLRYAGHEFFGEWFEKHDPTKHDGIVGPVEEFVPEDGGLGYCEATTGGTFIRIGVGVVRKPKEMEYQKFGTYEMVDSGKWSVAKATDSIEFRHELNGADGYSYEYAKLVRLGETGPKLCIDHKLKNTGTRPIATEQYNHNFFVIDSRTTGPEMRMRFPFELRAEDHLKGLADVCHCEIVFLRKFEKGESVLTGLKVGTSSAPVCFAIENHKTRAGVRVTGDRALSRLVFWAMRKTICPEPYIALRVEPGHETTWRWIYEFYELPVATCD